jgi:hypothetical protein
VANGQLAKVQAPSTGCLGLGLRTVDQLLHACMHVYRNKGSLMMQNMISVI